MLKNTFCSSPWYHFRIENDGNYDFCRWSTTLQSDLNIRTTRLSDFFNSEYMNNIRTQFLSGEGVKNCHACYYQGKQEINKVSGRERQLLKSGISLDYFDESFVTSPHFKYFDYSNNNNGRTNSFIADLQINLGTFCNSECIMCSPKYSSKLGNTFKVLGWLQPYHSLYQGNFSEINSWINDDLTLNNFVSDLAELEHLRYIHLIGGEPLIMPAFFKLCNALIDAGISKNITLGFTTNCTVWSNEIEDILRQFDAIHIGLSIETPTSLNDYIRYPSNIDSVKNTINKFVALRNDLSNTVLMLRPTPNILSIWEYDKLMQFGIDQDLHLETCNILYRPEWMQIKLLPIQMRLEVVNRIETVLKTLRPAQKIVNQRSITLVKDNIFNEGRAYQRHLMIDGDSSFTLRNKLILFLMELESNRKNSILTYLPEYEQFLRRYNYTAVI